MEFTSEKIADLLIVKPKVKEISYSNYIQFKSLFLEKFLPEEASYLLLDFSFVEQFDSTCISVVITIGLHVAKQAKKGFALCGLKGGVKKAFDLAHIDQLFPIFTTQEEAVNTLLAAQQVPRGNKGEQVFELLRKKAQIHQEENQQKFISSFKSRKEFEDNLKIILNIEYKQKPFYFLFIKSQDFHLPIEEKIKNSFLAECEQLIEQFFNKEYMKTYLGDGFFCLFAGWTLKDSLQEEANRFIAQSEYKILIPVVGNVYPTFSVLILECSSATVGAAEYLDSGMQYFDKIMMLNSEMRLIQFSECRSIKA